MEHAFGRKPPFGLGVEEELLLVDPGTHALAHRSSTLVPRVRATAGEVKHDVYEALVETASPVVGDAAAAAHALEALRGAGATLIGCGIRPDGAFGDVVHVDDRRAAAGAALRDGNAADRMRAAHARGGMTAVLAGLVSEAGPAAGTSASA